MAQDIGQDLLVTRGDGGIVTLTLNRPHELNAMTKPLWRPPGEAVRDLDAGGTVRCIVLRSAANQANWLRLLDALGALHRCLASTPARSPANWATARMPSRVWPRRRRWRDPPRPI